MKKGKEKRKKTENYIKKGEKGLKNASFWAINSKKNSRGGLSLLPTRRRKLICREKNLISKEGGGVWELSECTIYTIPD